MAPVTENRTYVVKPYDAPIYSYVDNIGKSKMARKMYNFSDGVKYVAISDATQVKCS